MLRYQTKRLVFDKYLGNNLKIYKNNSIIHKNNLKDKVILNRGMYGRYLSIRFCNIGLTYGSFISTRKFLNKPFYKKKR